MVSSRHHTKRNLCGIIKATNSVKEVIVVSVIRSQFTLRLDLMNHIKIRKIADAESRTMNNMIEYLIKKEIARYEKENGEIPVSEEELYPAE